jgi:DNA-binding transcriptional LysR family regulator
MVEAAIAGMGLSQVPDYMVADEHGAGRLVEVLREYRASAFPINVVYPSTRRVPPRVRVLIDALSERGAFERRIRLPRAG